MTRKSFRCDICGFVKEFEMAMTDTRVPMCLTDRMPMRRYFGDTREVSINYGFRESRYLSEEESNLAKFQFTNL